MPDTNSTIQPAGQAVQVTQLGSHEPALILLSGLGDPASWWFQLPTPAEARPHWRGTDGAQMGIAPALAATAGVMAYDRAGVGASAAPDHDRTWTELYAELEAVISALCLTRPPILVGHSLGGLIAYSFARRFPAAVSGLVLLDVTPPPMTQPPALPMPERLALTHFEPGEVAPQALGTLPLTLIAPGRAMTVAEAALAGRTATQEALDARFSRRRAQHQQLLATSTRNQALWTSGAGHYVHLEYPALVVEAILKLWDAVRKGSTLD